MACSNKVLDFEYNFEWCSCKVPALHIAPQACQKAQYEVEEQFHASHTPHSGFETHPCHLEKSEGKMYNYNKIILITCYI